MQKELSVSRRAQTRSQRKSMIVQVNKVPCSIKAIFDISKTVKHYVTIDVKKIHLLKANCLFSTDDEPYNASVPLAKHNLVPTRWVIIMFDLVSFLSTSSLSPPLFHFLFSDSPKVSPSQFAFVNIKKADGRRWSVASLPR